MLARLALALAVTLAFASGAAAGGEHHRRLAAELLVMAGDAGRLASSEPTPIQRDGLRARLAGALSSLPLLLRRAGGDVTAVTALRAAAARGDWRGLRVTLDDLQRSYPHDLAAMASAPATPERLALGQAIHAQACAGCHDAPARDTRLPAHDLFRQVAAMPRAEFAARLYLGVRGDRSTALRNPFSDLELGALIAWYASGSRRPEPRSTGAAGKLPGQ